jgi:hypothetical protein
VGATPVYGFPYSAGTDAPNGPAQIQALAEAVESKFVTSDAAIAAANANIGTYRKLVGIERLASNTGAFSSETAVLIVNAAPIPANTFYVAEFIPKYNVSVAGARWIYRFKDVGTNALLMDIVDPGATEAGVPLQARFRYSDVTTTALSRSLYVSVERYSGGGNYVAEAGSTLAIYAECPSALL